MVGRHAAAVLALLALLSATGGALARDTLGQTWTEARSGEVILASALGRRETAALAGALADFRRTLGVLTNLAPASSPVPTRIWVYPAGATAAGLGSGRDGYFLPTMRANYLLARSGAGMPVRTLLKHEYTHYLVRNHNGQRYPRWYDEGLAELLSTVEVDGGRYAFGGLDPSRVAWLNANAWLSYRQVLSDQWSRGPLGERDSALFYAQSWALLHYLVLGPEGAGFEAPNRRYLGLLDGGMDDDGAFEAGMGVPLQGLEARVQAHLATAGPRTGRLGGPPPRGGAQVRRLSVAEVSSELGNIELVLGNYPAARSAFEAARRQSPRHAPALAGLADVETQAGRYDLAEQLYADAMRLEPGNFLHRLDHAQYHLHRARLVADPAARRERLALAREELGAAGDLRPRHPEVLAMYGYSYQFPGEDPAQGLGYLREASAMLPAESNIRALLARACSAVGRPADRC